MSTNNHLDGAQIGESWAWMAAIILSALMLWFCGCRDIDPPLTTDERLQGFWKGGAWNHETSRYHFQDGAMWTEEYQDGVLSGRCDYQYTTPGDTLHVLDIASFERRSYLVSFGDDTARLETEGGFVLNLARIK